MPARKTFEIVLFLTCWFAFAWFNQGGGWNQNSRFGEVRAMAEEGRFAIDDFLVYLRNEAGDDLAREPVERAEYDFEGKRHRLCWVSGTYELFPIGEQSDVGVLQKLQESKTNSNSKNQQRQLCNSAEEILHQFISLVHLINLISMMPPGQRIRLQVWRDRNTVTLEGTVGDWAKAQTRFGP